MDFNRAEPTCYRTYFPYASSSKQNGAFSYIVLNETKLFHFHRIFKTGGGGGGGGGQGGALERNP